ncbi:MAG: APC family permease [Lewinellaceae bacterium]|nr:APC family permease [Lewinellaceae bacterium]
MNANTTPHRLGLFSVTMIVVSLIIGMGIFKTPALIAATAGTPTIFFMAWILGGMIAFSGAITFAEIGLRMPVTGAFYQIFSRCYHPAVGFMVNMVILVSNAASLAIVALIGADYVSDLVYGHPAGRWFNTGLAVLAVALFYGVNLLGLRSSSYTQNVMTVVKVGLILVLISAAFTGLSVAPHGYEEGEVFTYTGDNGLLLLWMSLIAVCFTFGGYQQTINFGGEVRRPQTLPKGIFWGILIVMILYLAINYAYVEVIGFTEIRNASAIGALLCEAWFGSAGAKIFDAAMFLSVLAYVNILLMSNPRVMYAMSEDKVLPAWFRQRSARTGALVPGLTVFAVLTIMITFIGKGVDQILGFTMFLDSIGMCTSAFTLFILRRRGEGEANAGHVWNRYTPWLAGFFVTLYGLVAAAVVVKSPGSAAIGLGLLLLFLVLYLVLIRPAKQVVTNLDL